MIEENTHTFNVQSILENLTRTLLYEGYALFPYHRSAVKNQKPIPFGVVFPEDYNTHNVHAHSQMQAECIVIGNDDLQLTISIRFLHLKRIELFARQTEHETGEEVFIATNDLTINNRSYQAGWQTVEHNITTGNILIADLIKNKKTIPLDFEKIYDSIYLYEESGKVAAQQSSSISGIKGEIMNEAARVETSGDAFRVRVSIANTTPLENAEAVIRDEVLSASFLSTHIILQAANGEFISQQNPAEEWRTVIESCKNINTWPILIDESNTTMLSSPIILYDHPQINPQSSGDLFDSTEIEEALLLHVSMLSDDEKRKIGQSDEKLQVMLNKVSQVTPEELISFHSGLKDNN